MGGGLMQLVATGNFDLYLIGDPQITFFKIIYRRHTEFALCDYPIKIDGEVSFGETHTVKIPNLADRLGQLTVVIDVPSPDVKMRKPTVKNIKDIIKDYEFNLDYFVPKKNDTDIVSFNELFDLSNENSLGNQMINYGKICNDAYNNLLDVLDYIVTNYTTSDNKYLGDHIAININDIDFSVFGSNVDKSGYLVLTYEKTKELLENPNSVLDLDETSFIYYQPITRDISPLDSITISTNYSTIDQLVKMYPNMVSSSEYIPYDSSFDLSNLDLINNKYHMLMSIDYLKKVRAKSLYLRNLYLDNSIILDDQTRKETEFNMIEQRKLLFKNFIFDNMIDNSIYDFGIYKFDDNFVFDDLTMPIKIKSIDRDNEIDDIGYFNRFNINENAIYQKDIDINNIVNDTYWLLNVDINGTINDDTIDNVIITNLDQNINIKTKYFACTQDELNNAPYKISHVWKPSIVKNVIIDGETKIVKPNNMIDGVSTVAKIYQEFYDIPSNETNETFVEFENLHKLLVSMYDDLMDVNNQSRNYKLDNIKLFNMNDIKKIMYNKLIKDIIYVDQNKYDIVFPYTATKYYRLKIYDMLYDNELVGDEYLELDIRNLGGSIDFLDQRNSFYQSTKFLLWSYYFENIYPKYNIKNDNNADITNEINYLSYMLFMLPIDPTNIHDPEDTSETANAESIDDKIRFAKNELTKISNVNIYDDNSFIENFDNYHRSKKVSSSVKIFNSKYLYAGVRYDTFNETDEVKKFMDDNIEYTYPDGYQTCINREVEFYHVLKSLKHSEKYSNETIYNYFLNLIIDSYTDARNYLYTISFRIVEKFLSTYYKDTALSNAPILTLEKINDELSELVIKSVNIVLINYVKLIFSIWKNSIYSDIELNPQYIVNFTDPNNYLYELSIDYNANYVKNYLNSSNDLTQDEKNLGDPNLLRAKHYTATNIELRPYLGYSYGYNINLDDSNTYLSPSSYINDTTQFIDKSSTFIQMSQLLDIFSDTVNVPIQRIKNNMLLLFRNNQNIVKSSNYVFWRDCNVIMKIVINNLNTDLNLTSTNALTYFYNTVVFNHLPVFLTYYYGQYMQYIVNTYISSLLINETNDDTNTIDNINFSIFAIENEDTINNTNKFNYEPDEIQDCYVRFMGTDVRHSPKCMFHNSIDSLSNIDSLTDISYEYLQTNILPSNNICPMCFRTIEFRRLHDQLIKHVVINPDADFTNTAQKYHIVDSDKIKRLAPKSGIIDNVMINNTEQQVYTTFLYRPESMIYDEVSLTYFYTATEFVVHRIATIYFRYQKLINNVDISSWELDNLPDSTQIGTAINGKTELDRFNDFVNYLTILTGDNTKMTKFNEQIEKMISLITHTNDDIHNFNVIKNIYTTERIISSLPTYSNNINYIGSKNNLNIDDNIFMIPNVIYDKQVTDPNSGVKVIKYQLYQGNVTEWVLIQREIVKNYNNLFNSVLNPTEINSISNLKYSDIKSFVNQNIDSVNTVVKNPDLFFEIYDILKLGIDTEYFKLDGTIDYYRNKDRQNVSTSAGSVSDFEFMTSTCMANYCRQLTIYYNMLLARYKKMQFLLHDLSNVTLNGEAYYFNFSNAIANEYLKPIHEKIMNMKIMNINQYDNTTIRRDFYYLDTSKYYFIDSNSFRNEEKNADSVELINDYLSFDKNNNFHLRQSFTLNQFNNMNRMIGLYDTKLKAYDNYFQNALTNYYNYYDSLNGLNNIMNMNIDVRNNFDKYSSINESLTAINAYDLFMYENDMTYSSSYGFNFVVSLSKVTLINSLFNRIWYYCPTVTNILYDHYYNPVILKSITSVNQFDEDLIDRRIFTKCLTTSPIIFLRDKIKHSIANKFTHTYHVGKWEKDFNDNNTININNAMTKLYNIFEILIGKYHHTDINTLLLNNLNEFLNGEYCMSVIIKQYKNILNELLTTLSPAFQLNSTIYMREHINTILTLSYTNTNVKILDLLSKYRIFANDLLNIFIDLQTKILNNITDIVMIGNVNDIFNQIRAIFIDIDNKLTNTFNLSIIIMNIRTNISSIQSIHDIEYYFNLTDIDNYVTTINEQFNGLIVLLTSMIDFMFVETDIDTRVYTPSQLFGTIDLQVTNNFQSMKDVVLFLTIIIIIISSSNVNVTLQEFLSYMSNVNNIVNLLNVKTDSSTTYIENLLITSNNFDSRTETFEIIKQNIKLALNTTLYPFSKVIKLERYIDSDITIAGFYRYDLDKVIINTERTNIYNYYQYKQDFNNGKIVPLGNDSNLNLVQPYQDSILYNQIIKILTRKKPEHAWVRYLGYRIIENISLVIDGQQIDCHDSDLMLLLYKMLDDNEHKRGSNIMIGHLPEMYEITNNNKPSIRLYIPLKMFFCKDVANSLPLVNMIYSNATIKIKFRNLDELIYLEDGAELNKPIKMKYQLLGNYVFLSDEERKQNGTIKTESLMERYITTGKITRIFKDITSVLTEKGKTNNVIKIEYKFSDPCKYLLWKINVEYPNKQNTDKIYWDIGNYKQRNTNNNFDINKRIINVVKNTMIEFNGKTREAWHDNMYYQTIQPINKNVRPLDTGEQLYSFCLTPALLQPSGATNMSMIDKVIFYYELTDDIVELMKNNGIKINFTMYECSYNVFVTMSGMCALRFYS